MSNIGTLLLKIFLCFYVCIYDNYICDENLNCVADVTLWRVMIEDATAQIVKTTARYPKRRMLEYRSSEKFAFISTIIKHDIIFQLCLSLYAFYRECYAETQKEMKEAADEKPFDCSDMYIFGKFETFKKRLLKVGILNLIAVQLS